MPVNQPTTVIPGNRNQVNISGAILTPFAQGLGEMAAQGVKDVFGFSTPAEDYQRQLTATLEDARLRNADKDWQERIAQADGGQFANNQDAQKQWAMDRYGWDEERAGKWANATAHDSVEAMRMRNTSQAQFQDNALDPMPTGPISSAMSGQGIPATTSPPFPSPSVQAAPTPTAPPQPVGPQLATETSQEVQQAQTKAAEALNTNSMPAEAPPSTPAPPPSTTSLAGQTPGSAPSAPAPIDNEKLRKDLQAYQVRQAANLSLYRQVAKAGITGQIDERQMALGAQLANTNTRELTQLMQTVAPALGTDWMDNNGNPIQGDVLMDGIASSRLQLLSQTPEALENLKKSSPGAYQAMQQASNRYNARLTNMSFANAAALAKAVEPIAKSNMISPEAQVTYWNARANRAQEKEQFETNVGLKKIELSMKQQELASSIGLQNVQTEQARFNLGMLERYAPQKEEMYLKAAQSQLDTAQAELGIKLKENEKADLMTGMAAFSSLMDIQAKADTAFFTQQDRTVAQLSNAAIKAQQEITRVESEWGDKGFVFQKSLKETRAKVKDETIAAWMTQNTQANDPIRTAAPSDQFDYYFRKQPGNQEYDEYKRRLVEARATSDKVQVMLDGALTRQPNTAIDGGLLQDSQTMARTALQERIIPGLRNQAKSFLKAADSTQWSNMLADDPTAVNKIVGEYASTAKGLTPVQTWDEKDSKALLELVGSTIRAGGKPVSPEALAAVPAGKQTLRQRHGAKFSNFYNAYTKLVTELK